MTNEEIDNIVESIDARQSATCKALFELKNSPDDSIKVNRLLELLGQASEELQHVRWQMIQNKKPIRKFALLMK